MANIDADTVLILTPEGEKNSPSPTRICPACEQRLTQASNAMRRHATDMAEAIHLVRWGDPTEDQRQHFTTRLVASFNAAQSAWDTYREHLIEHGLLPAPK